MTDPSDANSTTDTDTHLLSDIKDTVSTSLIRLYKQILEEYYLMNKLIGSVN